jgi:hypothetical protein
MKSTAVARCDRILLTLLVTLESVSPWLFGGCSCQMCRNIVDASRVYSQMESVRILRHCLESKLFAAVRKACSYLYP